MNKDNLVNYLGYLVIIVFIFIYGNLYSSFAKNNSSGIEENGVFINWDGVTKQKSDITCGAAVISTLRQWMGYPVNEEVITLNGFMNPEGMSLYNFERTALKFGIHGKWYKADINYISKENLPFVAFLEKPFGHFIIVRKVYKNYVIISDPNRGNIAYDRTSIQRLWSGKIFSLHSKL